MAARFLYGFLLIGIIVCVLNAGHVRADEGKAAGEKDVITTIIETALGKGAKVVRMDAAEPSPVSGFKQIRVWVASVYGETPVLFYVSEDGKTYLAGSVFDAQGNNLTKRTVGNTRPRVVKESDMKLNDDYRIGPKDAKIRAVLWIGADPGSRHIFDTFSGIYEKNRDKVSLYIKFYPRSAGDIKKMALMTCTKGEDAIEIYKEVTPKDPAPGWGSDEILEAIKENHGLKGRKCEAEIIRKDLELSLELKLPQEPVVFINGTMLIEQQTKENVSKIGGVELN